MSTEQSLETLIRQFSSVQTGPDRHETRVIDLAGVRTIADRTKNTLLQIEKTCLESDVVPIRYWRNIGTIGKAGQLRLLQATAVVCGAGGLGGTIIELLARQGMGHLVIIDNGRFSETDLNRQLMATEKDLGKSKVKIASERVKTINAAVDVTPVDTIMDTQSIPDLIKGSNIVMDGLDNIETRRIIAKTCAELKIPFIHGAIAGFSGQVMTVMPGDKGFNAVYGSGIKMDTGLEAFTGTPAATPAVIAAWQVQEAIKLITGVGVSLRNRQLFLDFTDNSIHEISM